MLGAMIRQCGPVGVSMTIVTIPDASLIQRLLTSQPPLPTSYADDEK